MPRWIQFFTGLALAAMIVAVPAAYAWYLQANFRNYRVMTPGVLYRSGQLSKAGLEQVVREKGIRTVVTLRDADVEGEVPPDRAEENWCKDQELRHVRIRPREWSAPDRSVPAEQAVEQFLKVMDEPSNYPVLMHCFAGSHRTGALCAIYRMEYDRWSNDRAIAEMRASGYRTIDEDDDVRQYLQTYVPRWKRGGGQ